MTVRDLARDLVVTTAPDTTAAELATIMDEDGVGSVVVTEANEPVGIVTDRDLAVRVLADGADPDAVTASDIMTPDPVTVEGDTGVFVLTDVMREEGVRRVPVVDDGDLVGIITLDDLNRLLVDELGNLADVVEAESPPY